MKEKSEIFKDMWIKGLPLKFSFLIWRIWKGKIPVEEGVRKWGWKALPNVGVVLPMLKIPFHMCF